MRYVSVLVLLVVSAILTSAAPAAKRHALVVGNASYEDALLSTPIHDAEDIAASLKALDFEVVLATDLTTDEFNTTLKQFVDTLSQYDTALFYYAGIGMQIDKTDYLAFKDFPALKSGSTATEAKSHAVAVDDVVAELSDRADLRLVFVDSARSNPFPRAPTRGLSVSLAKDVDSTIVIYSTGPDKDGLDLASDGRRNSPFAEAVLKHITTPDLELNDFLRAVAADVLAGSNGIQKPQWESNLAQKFYFVPKK